MRTSFTHTRVETSNGPVSGFKVESWRDENNNFAGVCDVSAFFGVPYAAPPTGPLRFRAPQPVQPWSETRACVGHPAPPQLDFYGTWDFDCTTLPMSEDCLYLDIWTPAKHTDEKLPVLVWIHGGAYLAGSTLLSKYDATAIARKGAIVVSVEFRVGVLAYLAHPSLSAESPDGVSGNWGFLDVLAALRWVRGNIASFGGDPASVTIFGESSGAGIMTLCLVSEAADGLFDRVIVESGTGQPTHFLTLPEAEELGDLVARELGCRTADELRAVSVESLLEVTARMRDEHDLRWEPNIDGIVLEDHVFTLFEQGRFHDVPTIFLGCDNDTPFFASDGTGSMDGIDADIADGFRTGKVDLEEPVLATKADYERYIRTFYGDADAAVLFRLFPVSEHATPVELKELAGFLLTFYQGEVRARRYAEIMNAGKSDPSTFVCMWGRVPRGWHQLGLGAFHEIDLAYLFGTLWPGYPQPRWDDVDRAFSNAVQDYWIAFAKTGRPDVEGLPAWRPYDEGETFLQFGQDTIHERTNHRELYELLLPRIREVYAQLERDRAARDGAAS